jgi:molecular chaperone GrpE
VKPVSTKKKDTARDAAGPGETGDATARGPAGCGCGCHNTEDTCGAVASVAAVADANANELAQARAATAENWDKYLRARADLENYQKRVQRDLSASIRYGRRELLGRLLGCVDNMDRAVAGWRKAGADAALVDGVEIIYRQLLAVLAAEGVKPMETTGKPFDPVFHDAVATWESPEVQVDTVSDELEKGYLFDGEVLRPAKVRVARPGGP